MEQDKKSKRGKSYVPVTKAPQGNVKGIGKMGQYIGGLMPTVIGPIPGVGARRIAPLIGRITGNDRKR